MLPFALKVVWFCLSLTGGVVCWIVLCVFASAIDSYWGPVLYCIFATVMQVVFCLGMMYKMNPYLMPKAFCIVQTVLIYYSAWSLTGVSAAFTFATTSSVLWPSISKRPASALGWKHIYSVPIFVFPLACLAISLPVLLNTNAIQATDDLHCDASHPEWGRFLGYAGLSMILTVPCLCISTLTAYRIYRLHINIQRSRYSFQPAVECVQSRSGIGNERDIPFDRVKSPSSPSDTASPSTDPESSRSPQWKGVTSSIDMQGAASYENPPSGTSGVLPASQKRTEAWEDVDEDVEANRSRQPMFSSSVPCVAPAARPNLAPAIWRLVLFQMVFFIVECLAALSTVIDVARQRPTPTPFGSQHIALILVGWGPAIIFGHLPAVRRRLMIWRR